MGKTTRKTQEQFVEEVYNLVGNEYTVLGEYKNNKEPILMRHNSESCNNNEWDCTPKWFTKGTRCPACQHRSFKKTTDEFKKEVYDLVGDEYTVLGEYVRTHTHLDMRHNECGHIYPVKPRMFLLGRRCPECKNKQKDSKAVKFIENYLKDNNIQFEREKTFEGFNSNKRLNTPYSFDFFLPEYNLLLEFDGEQHFRAFRNNVEKLKKTHENDLIKNQWVKEHLISLVRLNYKHEKNLEENLDRLFIYESSTTIESEDIYYISEDSSEILNEERYYSSFSE